MVDRLRRNLLLGVPAALALRPFAAAAQAPLRIEITEGVIEPMPFAAPGFVPDTPAAADLAGRITQVVIDDLTGTGLFREIPRRRISAGSPTSTRRCSSPTGRRSTPRR